MPKLHPQPGHGPEQPFLAQSSHEPSAVDDCLRRTAKTFVSVSRWISRILDPFLDGIQIATGLAFCLVTIGNVVAEQVVGLARTATIPHLTNLLALPALILAGGSSVGSGILDRPVNNAADEKLRRTSRYLGYLPQLIAAAATILLVLAAIHVFPSSGHPSVNYTVAVVASFFLVASVLSFGDRSGRPIIFLLSVLVAIFAFVVAYHFPHPSALDPILGFAILLLTVAAIAVSLRRIVTVAAGKPAPRAEALAMGLPLAGLVAIGGSALYRALALGTPSETVRAGFVGVAASLAAGALFVAIIPPNGDPDAPAAPTAALEATVRPIADAIADVTRRLEELTSRLDREEEVNRSCGLDLAARLRQWAGTHRRTNIHNTGARM